MADGIINHKNNAMNNVEIINTLINMDNKSSMPNILPWQVQEICRAQLLNVNTSPSKDELVKYAKSLSISIKTGGDVDNSKYFCFVPASKRRWKVFIVDRFSRVMAQLEDYEGVISEVINNTTHIYGNAFLVEI